MKKDTDDIQARLADMDARFAAWKAARKAEKEQLRADLERELAEGRKVLEFFGGRWRAWSTTGMECPPFIPQCMTAAYLAEHLVSRWHGFGTLLASQL